MAREADQWERRFKLLHSMVPEARRQEIIRNTRDEGRPAGGAAAALGAYGMV